MAAFKRSADGETITQQQRIHNDIDVSNKISVNPKIAVRMNPDFLTTRKNERENKKSVKKSASKLIIAVLGKRVENYDLINNDTHAQAGIAFSHIARGILSSPRMNY